MIDTRKTRITLAVALGATLPMLATTGQAGTIAHSGDVFFATVAGQCIGDDCTTGVDFTAATIKMRETNTILVFDDTSTAEFPRADWRLLTGGGSNTDVEKFVIQQSLNFDAGSPSITTPFTIMGGAPNDSLFVMSDGRVGVGTSAPGVKLAVADPTDASILVENLGATAGDKVMFKLAAKGSSKVRFAIEAAGTNIWTFDNTPNLDQFSISKVGTGQNEFAVRANGDGTFRGSSTATNHINTSTRSSKTDFEAVDVDTVLAKVASLPVSLWRYKVESEGVKHMGPVAEDFQELFGMGDGKTISTVDASGVALAAIKGLHKQLEARDQKIQSQEETIQEQDKRLLQLEMAVTELLNARTEAPQVSQYQQ